MFRVLPSKLSEGSRTTKSVSSEIWYTYTYTKQLLEASVKMLGEYVFLSGFKTKKCKFEVLDLKAFHQFIANSFPHWRNLPKVQFKG